MASIRERVWTGADGAPRRAWQVDFVDQGGKRRHKQFTRRKNADAWLVKARGQVATGTFTADSSSITIGAACRLWLERAAAEGLERNTREQYRIQVDHLLAAIDPQTKLSRLTQAHIEQVRDNLLSAHSRHTARKVLGALRMVLKDAKRRGLVAVNVAADSRIDTAKRHEAKIRAGVDFPLPGEVVALLEVAPSKAKAMVAAAALVGLRPSELRALRWTDLELSSSPTITVAQRADAWCALGSPKSGSSRRTIPLSETTALALKTWKLAQAPGRALVFGTGTDRPDMLGNLQHRLLTPLCAKAGVPRYTWHKLRHYAVSSWLAAGIDLKTAQAWAGHATLAMTIDTYGHLIPRADDHQRIAAAEQVLHATRLQHGRL